MSDSRSSSWLSGLRGQLARNLVAGALVGGILVLSAGCASTDSGTLGSESSASGAKMHNEGSASGEQSAPAKMEGS